MTMMTEFESTSPTSTTTLSSEMDSGQQSPRTRAIAHRANYRKSNKPLMEKKRRARINSCLTQLKTLVLQAMKKDNSQYSKLEKADILELTVRHLKSVQRCHTNVSAPPTLDGASKYRAGYAECATEVMRYLAQAPAIDATARTRILSHLASLLSPLSSTHTPILPAPQPSQQLHPPPQDHQLLQQQQQQQQQAQHLQQLGQLQLLQHHQHQLKQTCVSSQQQHRQHQHIPVKRELSHKSEPAPTAKDVKRLIHPALLPQPYKHLPSSSAVGPTTQTSVASRLTTSNSLPSTSTPLQLVPTPLQDGQMALVLAPQPTTLTLLPGTTQHSELSSHIRHSKEVCSMPPMDTKPPLFPGHVDTEQRSPTPVACLPSHAHQPPTSTKSRSPWKTGSSTPEDFSHKRRKLSPHRYSPEAPAYNEPLELVTLKRETDGKRTHCTPNTNAHPNHGARTGSGTSSDKINFTHGVHKYAAGSSAFVYGKDEYPSTRYTHGRIDAAGSDRGSAGNTVKATSTWRPW